MRTQRFTQGHFLSEADILSEDPAVYVTALSVPEPENDCGREERVDADCCTQAENGGLVVHWSPLPTAGSSEGDRNALGFY